MTERIMSCRTALLAIAAAAVAAAMFAPTEASARSRVKVVRFSPSFDLEKGLGPADFCGGRLPAYGSDACGYREVSHGPGSCWRRLPYSPSSPQPRRVWVCG
jgi:hypothetical protein